MMKRIKFIWAYIIDSEFRRYVDMKSAQDYVNEMKRMLEENQKYQLNKIYDR